MSSYEDDEPNVWLKAVEHLERIQSPPIRNALVQQLRREKRENPMWFLSFVMLGTLYLSLCSFLLGWGSLALWDALT